MVVLGELLADGNGEPGQVAGRRHLSIGWEAVRIHEMGLRHAELAGCPVHFVNEGCFRTSDGLSQHDGNIVGRSDDQCLQGEIHSDFRADREPDLAGLHHVGGFGHGNLRVQGNASLFQSSEREKRGHDLGERGWTPEAVYVVGVQHFPSGWFKQQHGFGACVPVR